MKIRAAAAAALALAGSMTVVACADGEALDRPRADVSTTTSTVVAPGAGRQPTSPTTVAPEPSPTRPPASTAPIAPSELGGIGDPYYPALGNRGYDVGEYEVGITANPATKSVEMDVTIHAEALASLDLFHLDLAGMTVIDVAVDDIAAQFRREDQELIITPPAPIAAGRQFSVHVRYFGTPVPIPDEGLTDTGWSNIAATSYVASEPNGAHNWLASNDHPSDKASFRFVIDVPEGTTAAANGELVRRYVQAGRSFFEWESDEPMATYLATVVIGSFTIVNDGTAESSGAPEPIAIRHVFPTTLVDQLTAKFDETADQIAVLSDLFGPYPFGEYGAVVIDARLGFALETQTLSIFDRQVALSGSSERFQIHELAHQWFGNSVTVRTWQEIWLNEGFASYAEHLYRERTEGGFDIDASIAAWAAESFGPIGDPGAEAMFEPKIYRRGAIALHALRRRIGDDTFFTVLRTWADRHRNSVVDTELFIALVNEVTGDDLTGFVRGWLDDETMPRLNR